MSDSNKRILINKGYTEKGFAERGSSQPAVGFL